MSPHPIVRWNMKRGAKDVTVGSASSDLVGVRVQLPHRVCGLRAFIALSVDSAETACCAMALVGTVPEISEAEFRKVISKPLIKVSVTITYYLLCARVHSCPDLEEYTPRRHEDKKSKDAGS